MTLLRFSSRWTSAQSGWGTRLRARLRSGNSRALSVSAVIPSGSGQLIPAALAAMTYSLTVLGEMPQLAAMSRWVRRASYFRRSTSLIFNPIVSQIIFCKVNF